MLFTDSSSAIQVTSRTYVSGHAPSIIDGWMVGGTAVLPTAQETAFQTLLN